MRALLIAAKAMAARCVFVRLTPRPIPAVALVATMAFGTVAIGCGSGNGNACATGYRFDATSNACVWAGGLADTGFDGTGASTGSGWTTSGEAVIDGGVAQLSPNTACLGGDVSQTVTLPASSATGPLALVVSARHDSGLSGELGASINGHWWDLGTPGAGTFTQQVVCLGDTYAGQSITVTLAPMTQSCTDTANIQIDSAELQQADETLCPTSGFIPNGDFESGDVAWQAYGDSGSGVGIDGINGSKGGRVVATNGAPTSLGNSIHIPSADLVAHPAIQLWSQSQPQTPGDAVSVAVELDQSVIGDFFGDPAGRTVAFCVPPRFQGRDVNLQLLDYSAFNTTDFDDVQLVDEPECDWSASPIGGDFEAFTNPSLIGSIVNGSTTYYAGNDDLTLVSGTDAYQGNGAGMLTVGSCMSVEQADALGVVPQAAGSAGPALTLEYRTAGAGSAAGSLSATVGGGMAVDMVDLTASATWTKATVCLGAQNSGRFTVGTIQFYLTTSSSCPGSDPMSQLYIDNVRFETSADCPVN